MIKISDAQFSIVHASIGPSVQVLASAGTGKTRVLTERVRHIVENTRGEGVITITFTNKAAEEMLARLDDIDEREDRCWTGTIHAIAQRVLEQYGHVIGLPSDLHIYERDQDRKAIFLQALRDNGTDIDSFLNVADHADRKDRERVIQNFMEHFSVVKRELLTEEEIKARYANNESFWPAYTAYQEALLASDGVDFDDILVYAHKILLDQPWCGNIYRSKYKHVFVDEAQDLNRAQYEFIKALCADQIKSVMMVGDPNQMIYGFNGSSHDYLCEHFVRDFQPLQFALKENYRSSKAIVRLANKLKPDSQVESDFALDGRCHIHELKDEADEAGWICDKIENLLKLKSHDEIEGEISLGKIVVIGRNRFVFQSLEEALQQRQIPYFLKKRKLQAEPTSIFAKVLDLGTRVRLNSRDWIDGKKLCATLGVTVRQDWDDSNVLDKLADDVHASSLPLWEHQKALLRAINRLDLDQPNIPKLCSDFMKALQAATINNSSGTGDDEIERSLQELQDYRANWTVFRRKGLGDTLSAFRNALALGQLFDDHNSAGLTLSTVHTMKGLEKDIVFLMGMCEGVFPDYRARSKPEIEEERNNAFVAVTRSRRWICITFPKVRKMPWGDDRIQNPSRFLIEMKK